MRAGLLKDLIEIHEPITTVNNVGEQSTTYQLKSTIKARVIHGSGSRSVENDEVIYPYQKNVQVRIYQDIDDYDRVKYDGKFYRILSIETNKDLQCKNILMEVVNE